MFVVSSMYLLSVRRIVWKEVFHGNGCCALEFWGCIRTKQVSARNRFCRHDRFNLHNGDGANGSSSEKRVFGPNREIVESRVLIISIGVE